MAARRTTSTTGGAPSRRAGRTGTTRRRPVVRAVPRVVEDDTEVLAAEHAARDAELMDLVARLSA